MKTSRTSNDTSLNTTSKPFVSGNRGQLFSSENKRTLFSKPNPVPNNGNVIQRQTRGEEIEESINQGISDEAAYSERASAVEATFPSDLTNASRNYMSFQGGGRLLRRVREIDRLVEINHLLQGFRLVMEGAGGVRFLDRNLTLAIAFRESGTRILSRGMRRINSFRAGGLDRLHGERRRLVREGFIPNRIARRWTRGESDPTEGSTANRVRHSNPVDLPERDLIVAYGGVVSERRQRFEAAAERLGATPTGISVRARRVWTALFFGGSGGLHYEQFRRRVRRHGDEEGWIGSHFGANTIMTFLVENRHSLNDILNLETLAPDLYNLGRTKSAFIVVAEAEVLDQVIPQFANAVDSDDSRISVGLD